MGGRGGRGGRAGPVPGRAHDALGLKARALPVLRARPDLDFLAATLTDMGQIELARGNLAEARAHIEDALRLRPEGTDPGGVSHTRFALADLLLAEGDAQGACREYVQVFGGFEMAGWTSYATEALVSIGDASLAQGDVGRALDQVSAALDRLRRDDDVMTLSLCLHVVAGALAEGDPVEAVRLIAARDRTLDDASLRLDPWHGPGPDLAALRTRISPLEFERAWAEGSRRPAPAALELCSQAVTSLRAVMTPDDAPR